jgi:glutaminyl-tRNA synthetase
MRDGDTPDGRKIKSTLHWVSAAHAVPVEVRLYDRLFNRPDPEAGDEGFLGCLNPNSLTVLQGCQVEGSLAGTQPSDRFQFGRQGYICADSESTPEHLVFNLAVVIETMKNPQAEHSLGDSNLVHFCDYLGAYGSPDSSGWVAGNPLAKEVA